MTPELVLPPGYAARALMIADAGRVSDLVTQFRIADNGVSDRTIDDLLYDWRRPRFNLATDALGIVAPNQEFVGYVDAIVQDDETIRINPYSGVHPAHRRHGLGTYLFRWAETWAHHLHTTPLTGRTMMLRATVGDRDADAARAIVEREGYRLTGHGLFMRIELDHPTPEPKWPAGMTVRTYVPGQDGQAVHALFREVYDRPPDPAGYIAWEEHLTGSGDFDAGLCFVVTEGQEVVGAALCYEIPDMQLGFVDSLGVRPRWRRLGLAENLLYHAFAEFQRRGHQAVELFVAADNPTGAVRLYERVGMRVTKQYDFYKKKIQLKQPC